MDAESFYSRLLASLEPSKPEEPERPEECEPAEQQKSRLDAGRDGMDVDQGDAARVTDAKTTSTTPTPPASPKHVRRERSPSIEEIPQPVFLAASRSPSQRRSKAQETVDKAPQASAHPAHSASSALTIPSYPIASPGILLADALTDVSTSSSTHTLAESPPSPAKPEKVPVAPPAPTAPPKTSTTLEAELRAKLLAASKKRKACPTPPKPPPAPPSKKPHRGSPVFTTVSVTPSSSTTAVVADSPNPLHTHDPNSSSAPHTRNASQSSLPGGVQSLTLPPKPVKRSPFALSISVPFPYASHPAGKVILQTERLPLETPITALLDVFGRRGETDCLWFPSLGENSVRPDGQCFFRQQRRTMERAQGWLPPSGVGLGLGLEARKSTLEDVYVPLGECVVECDLLAAPPPQAMRLPGFEGDEEEYDANAQYEVEDGYDMSPGMEEGRDWDERGADGDWGPDDGAGNDMDWEDNSSSHFWQGHPPVWQGPPMNHFQSPTAPWPFSGPPSQSFGSMDPTMNGIPHNDAQRWIPGHQDYESAGWVFGFGPNSGLPIPPMPPVPVSGAPMNTPLGPPASHSRNPSLGNAGGRGLGLGGVNEILSPPLETAVLSRPFAAEETERKKDGKSRGRKRGRAPASGNSGGGGGGGGGGSRKNKRPGPAKPK